MNKILYFAYGSNMSKQRICHRLKYVEYIGSAVVAGYTLAFHKASQIDGSAKCDIVECEGQNVFGVLYHLHHNELTLLDSIEGAGYERIKITVQDIHGCVVEAYTYIAMDIDQSLIPFSWYKTHILVGAREANLPIDYIATIESVVCTEDPDSLRTARELAIYN